MTTAILNLIAITAACSTIAFLAARANRYKAQRDVLRREAQTHQARIDFREGQIRDQKAQNADLVTACKEQAERIASLTVENNRFKADAEARNRELRAQVDPDAPTLDVRPEEL